MFTAFRSSFPPGLVQLLFYLIGTVDFYLKLMIIEHDQNMCKVLYKTAQKANIGPAREYRLYRGLILGSASRPADLSLRNWERGRHAGLDLTVISPFQAAVVDQEAATPGYALRFAWDRKMRSAFEACDAQHLFHPIAGRNSWWLACGSRETHSKDRP